jgi:hypothetical protein
VNGNASKSGGGSWATYSDARLKTVHGPFDRGLDELLQLNTIRYNYNDDNPKGIVNEGEHIGFVAQEVEKVIPEAVEYTEDGYLMLDNDPILWTMLNAVKEVNNKCEMSQDQVDRRLASLEAENEKKDQEIQDLRQRLERLEQLLEAKE